MSRREDDLRAEVSPRGLPPDDEYTRWYLTGVRFDSATGRTVVQLDTGTRFVDEGKVATFVGMAFLLGAACGLVLGLWVLG